MQCGAHHALDACVSNNQVVMVEYFFRKRILSVPEGGSMLPDSGCTDMQTAFDGRLFWRPINACFRLFGRKKTILRTYIHTYIHTYIAYSLPFRTRVSVLSFAPLRPGSVAFCTPQL